MEGAFRDPELKLIETFGWDGTGFVRLARHRDRMAASAKALGFHFAAAAFDAAVPNDLGPAPRRVRLTLDRGGAFAVTTSALAPNPAAWRIAIAQVPVLSADPRLAHKTTDRALYDRARAALPAGIDEYLFLNERGEAAEGTITTLFFDLGVGLRTPPLSSGCLPGCLRAELLATGRAREEPVPASLLPRAKLWMGNSLRGLIPAVLPAP